MSERKRQHYKPPAVPQPPTRERIIVALDCAPEEARVLARALQGHAQWLKVGMTLYYAAGPTIVRELKELGFKIFVDLKLHDIPHQVRGAAASIVRAGADMLTMHALGGADMLKAAVEGAREAAEEVSSAAAASDEGEHTGPILLAITILTSMNEASLSQVGIERELWYEVADLMKLAYEAGCDGIVCSPEEAERARHAWGPRAAIVTPGVRPAGGDKGDQSRVATPQEALQAGASHLVIGRPITAAADPAEAFEEIVRSIDGPDDDSKR